MTRPLPVNLPRYTLSRIVTPFQSHLDLLRLFLTHREPIVDSIDSVLNAQRKPIRYLQDRALLSRHFEDCFFANTALTAGQRSLKGRLEAAHWAAGFRPREVHHVYNDLIHPAEMMIRAFHCWQQTRWPGRNGRLHYAHTLFNLYLIRCLAFLSMRIWDDDTTGAGARLAEIQSLLDELWRSSPADQPAFVRDARWLIPFAQSLITDELAPYLEVSRQITDTLPPNDRLEIRKAHVRMLGGHLTSQIRYYCTKDSLSINEVSVVGRTRTSNALDFALLIHGLVELLKAYERALLSSDERMRLDMAGAILQGISVDPELFLNRVDLLSAYSMMEHVCIAGDPAGRVAYSPLGERHVELLKEYAELICRLNGALRDDAPRFRPIAHGCSPYGIVFGIPSNLIEHMALKALERDAETRFSLEEVFEDVLDDAARAAAKLAWVNGWRQLPHIALEVQRHYDYPQRFAQDIYDRIVQELSRHGSISATGRLYIDSTASAIPELPAHYFASSDRHLAAAHKAEPYERAQLLRERQEGHFLVSYETPGGWIALRKELLTDILAEGRDARIPGLPPDAARVLRLMCVLLVTTGS
jgi:hypothetical protein